MAVNRELSLRRICCTCWKRKELKSEAADFITCILLFLLYRYLVIDSIDFIDSINSLNSLDKNSNKNQSSKANVFSLNLLSKFLSDILLSQH
jgi:hypothetical protein